MKTLTVGMIIICKDHKNWGSWGVIRKYDDRIFEIRGRAGDRILDESEFNQFWEEVKP